MIEMTLGSCDVDACAGESSPPVVDENSADDICSRRTSDVEVRSCTKVCTLSVVYRPCVCKELSVVGRET